jgi:putative ATPase
MQPLAERMRPGTLDQVIGQKHLLGAGQIIRQIIERNQPTSLILWGPPGSGKTTLARIIARETGAEFVEMSAVTGKKADVTRVVEQAQANRFYLWTKSTALTKPSKMPFCPTSRMAQLY